MSATKIKYNIDREYKICSRCVMDTTDEDITFDENGVCMRCNEYKNRILPSWNYGRGHEKELQKLIRDIKKSGQGKKFDCILGLSGGLDSTYMLHLAVKEWGLRPFVFHIDAGWNLPVVQSNIQKVTNKLGVELHIERMNWDEMREMQLAWFRTGMEGLDSPQDHAFIALVDKFAMKLGVKYILNGYNISTEVVADPDSWFKDGGPTGDEIYMRDVIKKYCKVPIKEYTFTNGFKHKVFIPYILGVKTVQPLNFVPVSKQEMIDILMEEYGYEPYGQKHFENLLTKFLEGWWAPMRFGHDIRRPQLSSLIVTGQLEREDALKILSQPSLSNSEVGELFAKVAEKLGISEEELMLYHSMPLCKQHFRSMRFVYNIGIRIFEIMGIEKRIRK